MALIAIEQGPRYRSSHWGYLVVAGRRATST
jgi:hypothetical protein